MLEAFDRYWRLAGTGLSFLSFALGGLLLRVVVFPAIKLFVRKRSSRTAAARGVVRIAFRSFVWLMQALGVLRYELKGLHKLDRRGLLVVANHPTLIDTVFLMAFVKHADCIVKSGLWNNPFTHGPVRAAGYINNAGGPELIDDCIASLEGGNNLIIFPEGTRTPHCGTVTMKRGAANVAVRGRRDLTPVVIRCTPPTLRKGDKWWQVPAHRVHLSVEVKDDIAVMPFVADANGEALAARRLTDFLQDYFAEENKRHAVA
jgi:1-acyl-sn-glycerol-3-phosphate acyltransferase